jgi:hypothetical protein
MIRDFKEEEHRQDILQANMYKCTCCGRKTVIGVKRDRALCTWCGHYIYKSDELKKKYEFKERMRKELKVYANRI